MHPEKGFLSPFYFISVLEEHNLIWKLDLRFLDGDLGLPPLLENYPEPVIASGLFPPDYADMYRDWHRQLAEGIDHLRAVIPLTVERIPFHVRYTTEYDENGRPLKAYGSATFVVNA